MSIFIAIVTFGINLFTQLDVGESAFFPLGKLTLGLKLNTDELVVSQGVLIKIYFVSSLELNINL